MGPTIPGIKQILFWPETETQIGYLRWEKKKFRETFRTYNHLKWHFKPSMLVKSYNLDTHLYSFSKAEGMLIDTVSF